MVIIRKAFINKKTKQLSITIPIKLMSNLKDRIKKGKDILFEVKPLIQRRVKK